MCYQNISVTSEKVTECSTISLIIIKIWNQASNCTWSAWSIVIYLSKEVGCLCHNLLVQLGEYDFEMVSPNLRSDYLSQRRKWIIYLDYIKD